MKIKLCFIALFAAAAFLATAPTFAADCETEIAAFDKALAGLTSLDAQILAEVKYIRDKAAGLCSAGDSATAIAYIQQAKAVAGIQ